MIDTRYFWVNIFAIATGTLMIRGSLIALANQIRISERSKQIFSFIPAALLPAFIAPAVYFHQGKVDWLYGKERLFIVILATGVCYFTRNTLATIVFGLAALYLLTNF
jgi:branched-subunit amino acid transport protein